MNKLVKKALCYLSVFVLLLSVATPVFAATSTSSPEKSVTLLGYTYRYWSTLLGDETSVWGYIDVMADDNVPVGYIGVNSCLYNDSGALVKTTGWEYNDDEIAGWSRSAGKYYQTGTYYSKGQVKFYNGNGYYTYTAYATPYISVKTGVSTQILTNANGLTYGSDMLVENGSDTPDLILAIGTDGSEGYVYAGDVYGEYDEDALSSRFIPLYKEDGVTVIGTFEVSCEYSEWEIITE